MPRAKPKADAMVKSDKCQCNLVWAVVGWILAALGLWALVGGFATQFTSFNPLAFNGTILGWYFAGALLLSLAKMSKWKACGSCGLHKC